MENSNNIYDERVGFGRRLGAYLLDLLVALVFGGFIASFVGEKLAYSLYAHQMEETNSALALFASDAIDMEAFMLQTFAYSGGVSIMIVVFFILEGALGQSPGKMLLQLVNTNTDGTPANATNLWLRATLKYGSTLLALAGAMLGITMIEVLSSLWGLIIFVGYFFVFGDNKQTIHDMLAKTVVSRK